MQTPLLTESKVCHCKHVGITCLRSLPASVKKLSASSPHRAPQRPDVFPLGYTHGSFISGAQDVTNRGEPMSFADSVREPLQQAPITGGKRAHPRDWNRTGNESRGPEILKLPVSFNLGAAGRKRVGEKKNGRERENGKGN